MSSKTAASESSTPIRRNNLPQLDSESSDSDHNNNNGSDNEDDEKRALIRTAVQHRLNLTQQRLPPQSVHGANQLITSASSHNDTIAEISEEHLKMVNDHNNGLTKSSTANDRAAVPRIKAQNNAARNYAVDRNYTEYQRDQQPSAVLDYEFARYGAAGRPNYRIAKRDRGEVPTKEIVLCIFLVITGFVFLYNGLNFYFSLGQDWQPFIGVAFLTLCPGLYQLAIVIGAFFEVNGMTYNDIPRSTGWL